MTKADLFAESQAARTVIVLQFEPAQLCMLNRHGNDLGPGPDEGFDVCAAAVTKSRRTELQTSIKQTLEREEEDGGGIVGSPGDACV